MDEETFLLKVKGLQRVIRVRSDQFLLKSLWQQSEENVIPLRCMGGGCGQCKIRILSGSYRTEKMSAAHVSQAELASGFVLACKTVPLSDLYIEVVKQDLS
jgi:ferredoxin